MVSEKREIIRNAAVEVISANGFYNTRMQDIADKAGFAVGTLYNYFPSKDKVLEYIFKVEKENRLKIISELEKAEMNIKELLRKFLERHFEILVDNPHLGRVIVREKTFSREAKTNKIREFMQILISRLEVLFREAREKNEISNIDPHLMAVFFFGAMHGIIEYSLIRPEIELLKDGPEFIMQRIDHIFK